MTEDVGTIGALLRMPYEALLRRVYAELAAIGFGDIRAAHSSVFRYILPDGSRVTELAERAQMTKQSMGYLVESLSERSYVELISDPTDGRAKLVRLTRRGQEVQQAARAISKTVEGEWARLLGEEKMAQLRNLLAQLSDHLSQSG